MSDRRARNGLQVHVLAALCLTMLLWTRTSDAPVADAAMRGEVDVVRVLLRQGADVNAAQGDGMTALHWAAEKGDVEITAMLIFAGANLEAVTRLGDYTPLHLASKAGQGPTAETLLEAGADPNVKTLTGAARPLHFAAAAGSARTAAALLDHGAEVDARESQWGQTPLMFAAASDRVEVVKLLVETSRSRRRSSISRNVKPKIELTVPDRILFWQRFSRVNSRPKHPRERASRRSVRQPLRVSNRGLQQVRHRRGI